MLLCYRTRLCLLCIQQQLQGIWFPRGARGVHTPTLAHAQQPTTPNQHALMLTRAAQRALACKPGAAARACATTTATRAMAQCVPDAAGLLAGGWFCFRPRPRQHALVPTGSVHHRAPPRGRVRACRPAGKCAGHNPALGLSISACHDGGNILVRAPALCGAGSARPASTGAPRCLCMVHRRGTAHWHAVGHTAGAHACSTHAARRPRVHPRQDISGAYTCNGYTQSLPRRNGDALGTCTNTAGGQPGQPQQHPPVHACRSVLPH